MKKITAAMYAWGKWKVGELAHNPYSDTNILHRMIYERSVGCIRPRDRILCYDAKDVPKYVLDINRAWLSLSRRPKQCVLAKYGLTLLVNDVGQPYTARTAAHVVGVNFDTFERNVRRGVQTIGGRLEM